MAQLKRMMVPTDFSPTSGLALEYAVGMAARYGASICVLHVIEEPAFTTAYPDGYFADLPALRQAMLDEATRRLDEQVKICTAAKVQATTAVVSGRAATAIVREASARGTDLIVMGTHGRSGFAHLMLGSVAEKVVRSAPCPVPTVRDKAIATEVPAAELAASGQAPA